MAAQAMRSAAPRTQLRGVNQTRIRATKPRAIAIQIKNERKRPRFTNCLYGYANQLSVVSSDFRSSRLELIPENGERTTFIVVCNCRLQAVTALGISKR